MSDCSCGARGIDLDGHECVAWLRLELIKRDSKIHELAIARDVEFWRKYADHTTKELLRSNGALTDKLIELGREVAARDEQLAALGPWTVQTLRQYVADTSDGFECEPGCDSYGHTEFCPVTNTIAAFRLLRERLKERDHVIEVARAWRRCETHGDIDGARQWGCPDCVAQQRRELRERDERILELEHALKDALYRGERSENDAALAEQHRQAAQERLARVQNAAWKFDGANAYAHRLDIVRAIGEEYFAKHSPFVSCHCGLTTDKRHIHAEDGHVVYLPKEQP